MPPRRVVAVETRAALLRRQLRRLLDRDDTAAASAVAAALVVGELALCALIIRRVNYTEIDWRAYMEEVEGFLAGERDYRKLEGGTGPQARSRALDASDSRRRAGPLVYPAGFVYVYSALRWLTGGAVAAAQPLFALLYVASLALALRFTVAARALPPLLLPVLCLSKRLHSIYVLRLFNEAVAMLPALAMVVLAQEGSWCAHARAAAFAVLTLSCAAQDCRRGGLECERVREDECAALRTRAGPAYAPRLPHPPHPRLRRARHRPAGTPPCVREPLRSMLTRPRSCCLPPPSWLPIQPPTWAAPLSLAAASTSSGP